MIDIKLKQIYEDLKQIGRSNVCPGWDCNYCRKLFPRIIGRVLCPCHVGYSSHYLIRKVKEILNQLEKE